MNTNELISYVEHVYKLEKSIYMQRSFYSELINKKKGLEAWHPNHIISNPYEDIRSKEVVIGLDNSSTLGLLTGIVVSILVCILTVLLTEWDAGFICIGAIIGIFLGFISSTIATKYFHIKATKKINQVIHEKNNDIIQINQKTLDEICYKLELLYSEINTKLEYLNNTKKILNDYYDKNILFEKYRNIYAISSIYEYLKSGRCSKLEDYGGAYNLYESELRQGIIINKLDTIISKLDRIKQNQYLLYQVINETNENTKKLSNMVDNAVNSLQNISNNSEIMAYNTQIIAQNEFYQSALMTYSTIKMLENN